MKTEEEEESDFMIGKEREVVEGARRKWEGR